MGKGLSRGMHCRITMIVLLLHESLGITCDLQSLHYVRCKPPNLHPVALCSISHC